MHKTWFGQSPVNLPFNRFILEDVLKRNVTYVFSAFPYIFAIFIFLGVSSSDDKESFILKNQTKIIYIALELISFLPSFFLNVYCGRRRIKRNKIYKTQKAAVWGARHALELLI